MPADLALALPTLVSIVTTLACWLRFQDFCGVSPLARCSHKTTRFSSAQDSKTARLLPSSSSPLACPPRRRIQASCHPAHLIGQFAPPGRLCLVTPELSTTPTACAARCRLNPLSLISPHAVSRMLRSAGVGHELNSFLLPSVGIDDMPTALSPDPMLTNPSGFSQYFENPPGGLVRVAQSRRCLHRL